MGIRDGAPPLLPREPSDCGEDVLAEDTRRMYPSTGTARAVRNIGYFIVLWGGLYWEKVYQVVCGAEQAFALIKRPSLSSRSGS